MASFVVERGGVCEVEDGRVRRAARVEVLSIKVLAKRFRVHRRTIRQALSSAEPPARKAPVRAAPKLDAVRELIDGMLAQDIEAPRKQWQTATRNFLRCYANERILQDNCSMIHSRIVHLAAGGVSFILEQVGTALPTILHWGSDAAVSEHDLHALAASRAPVVRGSGVDVPYQPSVAPEAGYGWPGRVAVEGHRGGAAWSTRFEVVKFLLDGRTLHAGDAVRAGAGAVRAVAEDSFAQLRLELELELGEQGLLRHRATLVNIASAEAAPFDLGALRLALPVPQRATEVLSFGGGWAEEKIPFRQIHRYGTLSRESRRGRTGLDATMVLAVGESGFDFRTGDVWMLHVGFSGNHEHSVERFDDTALLLGGELLLPGEVRLQDGQGYTSPWVYGSFGSGLDQAAHRFHNHIRARSRAFRAPRPVTLNVWEAVYFDHDSAKLEELATKAASIGVERFVLDDGWFRGRDHDRAGLGDWIPDSQAWPQGLAPFADHVENLGMQFGLWVEPEMVNVDSDLARAHPDWILRARPHLPVEARHQQVLDLTNPAAFEHILDALTTIIRAARVRYLKWDHNRDLVEAGHPASGAAAVHDQTLAAYELIDKLRARFPDLEIESCSSGGGRIDLGILERTDRVWPSDNMDPLDRTRILRWTGLLVPAGMTGSHVASAPSHVTGRMQPVDYRAAVAFLGHFGIEWDLTAAPAADLDRLAWWIARYKSFRGLIRDGDLVNADAELDAHRVRGVVSNDRGEGLFVVLPPPGVGQGASMVRFPALDTDARYRVHVYGPDALADDHRAPRWTRAAWRSADPALGVEAPILAGSILNTIGVAFPSHCPEQALLVHLMRADDPMEEI